MVQILVSAHSSGSYVAQEFLYLLYTKGMDSKGIVHHHDSVSSLGKPT